MVCLQCVIAVLYTVINEEGTMINEEGTVINSNILLIERPANQDPQTDIIHNSGVE